MKTPFITVVFIFISCFGFAQFVKPGMVLTFDDAYIKEWHQLLPILEKYNARATFFVTQPYGIDENEKQLLKEMVAAGQEIGSHSYNHYNALNFVDTAGIEAYLNTEIIPSINWLEQELDIEVSSFAYPYGARNGMLDAALLNYFEVIRGTSYSLLSNINKISDLSHSGLTFGVGIDTAYNHSLLEIKQNLSKVSTGEKIQVFYSHKPTESISGEYQIRYSTLDSILNYADSIGLEFYTISEVKVPEPPAPVGDTLISYKTESSDFFIPESKYDTQWKLTPESAGKVQFNNTEFQILWNEEFYGEALLSAAWENVCGQGSYSTPLKVIRQKDLNVSEDVRSISMYPNPTKGQVFFTLPVNENYSVEVYTNQGQLILCKECKSLSESLIINNQGLYMVKINSDSFSMVKKLLVE